MWEQIDSWLIDRHQRAYLWIYDWTGIYVGTLASLLVFVGQAISQSLISAVILNLLISTPNLIYNGWMYYQQSKNDLKGFNIRALGLQKFGIYLRLFMVSAFITISISAAIDHLWGSIGNIICLASSIYLTAIMIREREPKEWFKKSKLAMEGA